MAVHLPQEVHFEDITFGKEKERAQNGRSMTLFYEGAGMYIQTPWMRAPFGVQSYDSNGKTLLSVNLNLSEGVHTPFINFLQDLDLVVAATAKECGWEAKLFSLIRPNYNRPELPDMVRLKIVADRLKIYKGDEVLQKLEPEEIIKVVGHSAIRAICHVMPVWFAGGKCGTSLRAVKIQIRTETEFV